MASVVVWRCSSQRAAGLQGALRSCWELQGKAGEGSLQGASWLRPLGATRECRPKDAAGGRRLEGPAELSRV